LLDNPSSRWSVRETGFPVTAWRNPPVWSVCRKLTWRVLRDYFRIGGEPPATSGDAQNDLLQCPDEWVDVFTPTEQGYLSDKPLRTSHASVERLRLCKLDSTGLGCQTLVIDQMVLGKLPNETSRALVRKLDFSGAGMVSPRMRCCFTGPIRPSCRSNNQVGDAGE
jgi:hypothetical protein